MADYVFGAVVAVAVVLIAGTVTGGMGVGAARAPSEYTGQVVDVEHNRGFIFRTTQLNMKTHRRSSSVETFCVLEDNMPGQLELARDALNSGARVRVEYSRPYFVWVGECESGTSIVRDIVIVNSTGVQG